MTKRAKPEKKPAPSEKKKLMICDAPPIKRAATPETMTPLRPL